MIMKGKDKILDEKLKLSSFEKEKPSKPEPGPSEPEPSNSSGNSDMKENIPLKRNALITLLVSAGISVGIYAFLRNDLLEWYLKYPKLRLNLDLPDDVFFSDVFIALFGSVVIFINIISIFMIKENTTEHNVRNHIFGFALIGVFYGLIAVSLYVFNRDSILYWTFIVQFITFLILYGLYYFFKQENGENENSELIADIINVPLRSYAIVLIVPVFLFTSWEYRNYDRNDNSLHGVLEIKKYLDSKGKDPSIDFGDDVKLAEADISLKSLHPTGGNTVEIQWKIDKEYILSSRDVVLTEQTKDKNSDDFIHELLNKTWEIGSGALRSQNSWKVNFHGGKTFDFKKEGYWF